MRTLLQVLSEDERHQVHDRTLSILSNTGVRVDTAQGRQILKDAGVDHILIDSSEGVQKQIKEIIPEGVAANL